MINHTPEEIEARFQANRRARIAELQVMTETAVKGIVAQGGPSARRASSGDVQCLYRLTMPDGACRKCAIGHLIPEGKYDPSFDPQGDKTSSPQGLPITDVIRTFLPDDQIQAGRHDYALRQLQAAHDNAASKDGPDAETILLDGPEFMDRFRDNIFTYAKSHDLDFDAIDRLFEPA